MRYASLIPQLDSEHMRNGVYMHHSCSFNLLNFFFWTKADNYPCK